MQTLKLIHDLQEAFYSTGQDDVMSAAPKGNYFNVLPHEKLNYNGGQLWTGTHNPDNLKQKQLTAIFAYKLDFWDAHKAIALLLSSYTPEEKRTILLEVAKGLGSAITTQPYLSLNTFAELGLTICTLVNIQKGPFQASVKIQLVIGGAGRRSEMEELIYQKKEGKIILPEAIIRGGVLA